MNIEVKPPVLKCPQRLTRFINAVCGQEVLRGSGLSTDVMPELPYLSANPYRLGSSSPGSVHLGRPLPIKH